MKKNEILSSKHEFKIRLEITDQLLLLVSSMLRVKDSLYKDRADHRLVILSNESSFLFDKHFGLYWCQINVKDRLFTFVW